MKKKPWPSDALIVVASVAGQERREQMESVVHKTCRDCDGVVAADSFTIRRSENHPQRYGRPVQFLCLPCSTRYDMSTIEVLEDHRTAEGKAMVVGGWTQRQKLGSIFTDTAMLLIGDPCKVLFSTDDQERNHFTWEQYVDLCGDFTRQVVEIPDLIEHGGGLSVQVGCDGWYPVFLETDEHGKPMRLVIELGGQAEP